MIFAFAFTGIPHLNLSASGWARTLINVHFSSVFFPNRTREAPMGRFIPLNPLGEQELALPACEGPEPLKLGRAKTWKREVPPIAMERERKCLKINDDELAGRPRTPRTCHCDSA
jgi:hypothetical protein